MYEMLYHRASSVEDAAEMIKKSDDAKLLAGGQTLLPTMKQRLAAPSDVIDLCHIKEMQGISVQQDGCVRIGAAVTHAEVAADPAVNEILPGLAGLAGSIGDQQVRHMGTIGGSIANNDPAADYPSAILALDATVETNKRRIGAEEFFTGMFETALEEDEIVTGVIFPPAEKAAYAKFPNPASRYAMAGVFVALKGGVVRVAVTGAGSDGVFRLTEMENALAKDWSEEAIDGISVDPETLLSDIHGSAEYRANLVSVMAKRAVAATL